MRYVKAAVLWGDIDIPKGYISVAIVVLDPDDVGMWFTVAVPVDWLGQASEMDKARVVGRAVLRELVDAAKNANR